MKNNEEGMSFKDIVAIFTPKLWIIIICAVVLGLILSCYAAFIQQDNYTSNSLLMIAKKSSGDDSISQGDRNFSSSMIETYSIIISSDNFLNKVINSINNNPEYKDNDWELSVKQLNKYLKISQRGDSEIFDISVTTDNAKKSYAISQAIASQVATSLDGLLPSTYDEIGVSIIDGAKLAKNPNDKGVVKKGLIGLIVGAVISMIFIFIHSLLDVVIRDKKDLEDNFDIPILGVIPKFDIEGK